MYEKANLKFQAVTTTHTHVNFQIFFKHLSHKTMSTLKFHTNDVRFERFPFIEYFINGHLSHEGTLGFQTIFHFNPCGSALQKLMNEFFKKKI